MSNTQLESLIKGWQRLRLAVAAPNRVPTWDVICVTASNENQAFLYRQALEEVRRRGLLPSTTTTYVVEDPGGKRIGSGGATLHALRELSLQRPLISQERVLLIHAGGDSRRLAWASVLGKVFIPVPLLADPDRSCPTLFEHLLAITSCVPEALEKGGMLCLTGDVLPIVDLGSMMFPHQGMALVTTPAPLTLAHKHGVVVSDAFGNVKNLLQKPNLSVLQSSGAILSEGGALIDTGIWFYAPDAFRALVSLATLQPNPILLLLSDGRELCFYEDLPAACLAEKKSWLLTRPLGTQISHALSGISLHTVVSDDLRFLHFGTSAEFLDHLSRSWEGNRCTRLLVHAGSGADRESILISSDINTSARIGRGSFVAGSILGSQCAIGSRCIVGYVNIPNESISLPDHHILWQVPVRTKNGSQWVTAWCGVDDNPKDSFSTATFGNRLFSVWMEQHGIAPQDLWLKGEEQILWHAKLFPVSPEVRLDVISWMLSGNASEVDSWRSKERLSLAQISAAADPHSFVLARTHQNDRLVMSELSQAVTYAADRDISSLATQFSPRISAQQVEGVAQLLSVPSLVAPYRAMCIKENLSRVSVFSKDIWSAVASAVQTNISMSVLPVSSLVVSEARHSLPARIDIAGGWSDTPPYCLERPSCVVGLAVKIHQERPIGASVVQIPQLGVEMVIDGLDPVFVAWSDLRSDMDISLGDPYALMKATLLTCGFYSEAKISQKCGLRVRAWSRLPVGSGLGGSSILAAALVTVLQKISGRSTKPQEVGHLVMMVEQRLGTGGGWQDQFGALVPGAKTLSSVPVTPLRIHIAPILLSSHSQLLIQQRLVLIDTGITRLARNVLQRVMGRWMARESLAAQGLARLTDLARDGANELASGRLDVLAKIIREVWDIHLGLDPMCSTPQIEALFTKIAPYALGWKLCGAGGGGFAIVLARDEESVKKIADILPAPAKIVEWSLDVGNEEDL